MRIYTKTFGGKIWRNLHRVPPDNFIGKKSNSPSLKFLAKNYSNSISSERLWAKRQCVYTFLAKLRKFFDNVSFSRQFRLAGNDVREFSRKSIIVMYNQFNQNLSLEWIFFGVVQIWRTINCFFVFVFVLCRAIMLFRDERSLKSAFECNTGWKRPGNFYFFKHGLFWQSTEKKI